MARTTPAMKANSARDSWIWSGATSLDSPSRRSCMPLPSAIIPPEVLGYQCRGTARTVQLAMQKRRRLYTDTGSGCIEVAVISHKLYAVNGTACGNAGKGMRRGQATLGFGWVAGCASLWLGAALAQDSAQPPDASPAPEVAAGAPAPATVQVAIKPSVGEIVVAVETERAPITAANFLRYVDQKRLDGSEFYRAMLLDDDGQYGLIQGGLRGNPKRVLKPIAHEPTSVTGLSHVNGAISMARADPGTATADFFVVIGDLVSLDAQPNGGDPGYAVFGHVVDGMDVVHAILSQPRSPTAGEGVMQGQMLAIPVKILTVRRAQM